MVNIFKRMRRLKELLDVRLGPGAMIMKPEVTRIHMQFARKINGGHMGPRKFWHHMLPRLKYHNPAVPMSVNRTEDQDAPAVLSVCFSQTPRQSQTQPDTSRSTSSSDQTPDESAGEEREETIDMKMKTDTEILEELTRIVDGQQIEPTVQEREELESLTEQKEKSERDAKLVAEVTAKRRREQDVREQARRSALMQ